MIVAQANNLTIEFPVYNFGSSRSIKNKVLNKLTGGLIAKDLKKRTIIRALNNINFSFSEGDKVGIIGSNGSGKSTLLRVLAGVYIPTIGELNTKGRIMSMLSITLGIDMEASGFENIYLRGIIMGYSKAEIDNVLDEIVDFSGIGKYLELPIRTYSSGMMMRLAFAISTSMTADILLMDEWLSVGDSEFTEKANKRIRASISKSKILFFASHNESLIRSVCNKIIYLDSGMLIKLEKIN